MQSYDADISQSDSNEDSGSTDHTLPLCQRRSSNNLLHDTSVEDTDMPQAKRMKFGTTGNITPRQLHVTRNPKKVCFFCKIFNEEKSHGIGLTKRDMINMKTCKLYLIMRGRHLLCSSCRLTLYRCANSLRLQFEEAHHRDITRRRVNRECVVCGQRTLLKKLTLENNFVKQYMMSELTGQSIVMSNTETICRYCSVTVGDLEMFFRRQLEESFRICLSKSLVSAGDLMESYCSSQL